MTVPGDVVLIFNLMRGSQDRRCCSYHSPDPEFAIARIRVMLHSKGLSVPDNFEPWPEMSGISAYSD